MYMKMSGIFISLILLIQQKESIFKIAVNYIAYICCLMQARSTTYIKCYHENTSLCFCCYDNIVFLELLPLCSIYVTRLAAKHL